MRYKIQGVLKKLWEAWCKHRVQEGRGSGWEGSEPMSGGGPGREEQGLS